MGDLIHIEDSIGNMVISEDPRELLHFLWSLGLSACPTTAPRCVWDLDEFASRLLEHLPKKDTKEPVGDRRTTFYEGYKIFSIPGKMLSIKRSFIEIVYADISQYFPSDLEPDTVLALQEKVDLLLETLHELGIESVTNLISPVAVASASKMLDEYQGIIPTIFDLDDYDDAMELARQCTPREWVCNYQVGHFGESHSVDIASSYPSNAAQLLDLRDCSIEPTQLLEGDGAATYGFLVGKFTVYPDHPMAFCSPFLADRGDGTLVNFTGTAEDYPCQLSEVRALYRHNLGEFQLDHGWFIKPREGITPRLPFQAMMPKFYQSRSQSPTASFFLKRVMNGVIGKLLETRVDGTGVITAYGDLYNAIYHAIITTATRLRVFDFLVSHAVTPAELIHIGVDGIELTRHIALPEKAEMGEWRYSGVHPMIVLSPGAVITPKRNYKRTGYAELLEQLQNHPAASKFGKDGDIDLRDLFALQQRQFENLPMTGNDLLRERYQSASVGF